MSHTILGFLASLCLLLAISSVSDAKFTIRRLLLAAEEPESYAVIFDAGSTGSRVHVFRFDENMDLVKNGEEYDAYEALKPGLSSYANDPEAAAASIVPLLEKAQSVVPQQLHSQTPLRLGATAGLRLLEGDASDRILEAVRNLIKTKSDFKYKAEWISLLEGIDEGAYLWVAINYLLGTLGKTYPKTVCTIDLGGGSVQMAYAIPDETAANAPRTPNGEPYVLPKELRAENYNLYSHSYLNYGLMAARAEILKASGNSTNPCILSGYDGIYVYNGVTYKASSIKYGPNMRKCRNLIRKALNVDAPCNHQACTFGGVWNGGGGLGQNTVYTASYFYDTAAGVGIVDKSVPSALKRPMVYKNTAYLACSTKFADVRATFPNAYESDLPFLCMDLLYEFTLLVDGFGLHPLQEITLVKQIKYKDSLLEAAWPLGSAIDVVSSTETADAAAVSLL